MYLLYLDESGTHPSARHLVLAGVALHESRIYWATDQLNILQRKYLPGIEETVQFHATLLRGREIDTVHPPFDQLDRNTRFQLLGELYRIANDIYGTFFAVVVEKAFLRASNKTLNGTESESR